MIYFFISGRRRKPVEKENTEQFTIPCNLDVSLDRVEIDELDLYTQYKYQDYKWLLDFSFAALIVYILIELAALWRPQIYTEEFNIGFVWCSMVVFFAIKELVLLTAAYWKSEEGGERSMSISFGFFFLVMAMGILVIDESIIDFGLNSGYKQFAENLEIVYTKMNIKVGNAPSIWTFKVVLAFFSAFLGAVVGFPGIRYANMHLDTLCYYEESRTAQVLFNVIYFSPLGLVLLWISPLSKDLLFVHNTKTNKMKKLLSDEDFVFLQIHIFIVFTFIRLLLSRKLLQSHLNSACTKVAKLKKETGRISNVELQRTVARVFYYLSAAALQYMAPLILMLFLALMLRTLTYNMLDTVPASSVVTAGNTSASAQKKEYAKLIRSIFSVPLVKGICSYLTWWTLVVYFMTSCFGMVYLKFLT